MHAGLDLPANVCDRSGFSITPADLQFLNLTIEDFTSWWERHYPLGLNANGYSTLLQHLTAALTADRVEITSVDVRLKGSSVEFFSSPYKRLPTLRSEIVEAFRELRQRTPLRYELDRILSTLASWLGDRAAPAQRPFDSMCRLEIDRAKSDYDLQLSSTAMVHRCEALASELGITVTRAVVTHPRYAFVRKDLVRDCFPNLEKFCALMSDVFQRYVTVALFDDSGPPNVEGCEDALYSAHFRESDWRLDLQI